ncbi:MAG TPA: dihydrofolate reductase family protein [Kofleriaceae bacterium]|nr:dihydrofolate reductase family protein [Kofleriaceae bacterium]
MSLTVFNSVSLDGYFTDDNGDMRWAYEVPPDPEFDDFVAGNARGGAGSGGAIVFGRVTYEMMAGYWPTPEAAQAMPDVAASMNKMTKYVFSRSLRAAQWQNTRVVKGDVVKEVRRLKADAGDLVIMGSGSIVAPLVQAGLVDELQLVVTPVVLGAGRTMFEGAEGRHRWTLAKSRVFKNGKVSLTYQPARAA